MIERDARDISGGKTMRGFFRSKLLLALTLSGMMTPLLALPSAQAFPDRPVKLVVGSPAGGPPDIMARLLSDKMGAALGQPVIIENRAGGAGGTIAARSVIASEPDGHTLMMGAPARFSSRL